jgi:hypothetical protein
MASMLIENASVPRGAPYENPRRGLSYIGFRVAKTLD